MIVMACIRYTLLTVKLWIGCMYYIALFVLFTVIFQCYFQFNPISRTKLYVMLRLYQWLWFCSVFKHLTLC